MGHGQHRHHHHGGGGHEAHHHHHHGGGGGADHLSLFFYLCYCLCSICEILARDSQQPSQHYHLHHQESSCKSSVYVIDTSPTSVYRTDEVCLPATSSDIGGGAPEDDCGNGAAKAILIVFFIFVVIILAIIVWSIDDDCNDDDCY